MSLRPFFCYYGGKWRAAPLYPAPCHARIVEPFAGSAGYALRYPERDVLLCEADGVVASVWSYIIAVSADEILALPDVPPEGVAALDVCQEARWLIGFWLNKGVSSPRQRPPSWMRSGMWPGSFWGARVRETIAAQLHHIRHWRVFHGSYENCPETGPATWFVDPPYQRAGKHYRHGSSRLNYGELGAWCATRRGQVIVCENTGADWLPFSPLASIKATHGRRRAGRSEEAVWTNGVAE